MILIDSNVLIDIFGDEQEWRTWSGHAVESASIESALAVSIISIAEVAPRLGSLDRFNENIGILGAGVQDVTHEGAFLAGQAFSQYRHRRKAGDTRLTSVLPDFFIGAQAQLLRAKILTRDPRFYRAYFPEVPLITPSEDDQ